MDRSGQSLFHNDQSIPSDWQDPDASRPSEAIQDSLVQQYYGGFYPFGGELGPQSQLDASQMAYNTSYPTFYTDLHQSASSIGISNSYLQDTTYGTGTGLYKRQQPLTNDTVSSNVTRLANDYTQFTDWSDPFDLDPSLPVKPSVAQNSTEPTDNLSDSMRKPSQWSKSTSTVHRPKKRAISSSTDSANGERPPKKCSKKSPSNLIGATTEQEAKLEHQLREWEKRHHLPTEKEVRAIATLAGLSFLKAAMWYGDRLRLHTPDLPDPKISRPDPSVIEDIAKHVKDAKTKPCHSSYSEKGEGGKYICTKGCGYSTNQRDAWIRHEEKTQPQKFWQCIICRAAQKDNERKPCIVHRADKFGEHAKKCHPLENADQLRDKSRIPYDAPFIRSCNFIVDEISGLECGHIFKDWDERNHHYFKHFDNSHSDASPQVSDDDGSEDDDDDSHEEHERDSFNGSHGNSNPAALSGPFLGASQYHHSYYNQASAFYQGPIAGSADGMASPSQGIFYHGSSISYTPECVQPSVALSSGERPAPTLAAHYLIRIESFQAVEAESGSRYLALKYSAPQSASARCLESSQILSQPTLPNPKALPCVFQKVLSLAKDMGFEYIWIDVLCGLRSDMGGIDAVYEQADLILVVGHPCQRANQIWHFVCDYTHLNMVQSWAKQSVSFHSLKQLGHGAYGVVDKIELRPSHETFARKTIFCTSSKRILMAQYLQEIEIMRKLRHPHIARFEAAYFDQGAFNILMSPVADCDLRRYLACPEDFPEKREYLMSWFMSLAEALAYVHGQQCRHKDIKPANILISGRNVLMTDFGTSLDFSTSQSKSVGGCLMTPKYSAPEVASHGSRGRSADVFSLGCVFAEMITVEAGKSLDDMNKCLNIQEETNRHATYHEHLKELMGWLRRLYRTCLGGVQKCILRISMKMLNKSPEQRPSALDVSNALCPTVYCHGLDEGVTCRCPSCGSSSDCLDNNARYAQRRISSLESSQPQAPKILHGTQSEYVIENQHAISYPIREPPMGQTDQCDVTIVYIRYNLPDLGKLLSKRQMRYWQDLLATLLTELLKLWSRGLEAIPTVPSESFARESASQIISRSSRAAHVRKSPVRRCRAASLDSSRMVSNHVL